MRKPCPGGSVRAVPKLTTQKLIFIGDTGAGVPGVGAGREAALSAGIVGRAAEKASNEGREAASRSHAIRHEREQATFCSIIRQGV